MTEPKRKATREDIDAFLRRPENLSEEDHLRAMEAMRPYLEAFQRAADEQVREDFGVVPGAEDDE
jgi:hypothetical protein